MRDDRPLRHRADLRELSHWHRGARGEERVGAVLDSLCSDGFQVLHDVDTGRGNIDHVLVGRTGVFAIETKAWRGRVWLAKGGTLMCSRMNQEAALTQAKRGAMEVRRRLAAAGPDRWVEAVVVLASPTLPQGRIRKPQVTVIDLADLRGFVAEPRQPVLSPNEVARTIAVIYRNGYRAISSNVTSKEAGSV